MSHENALETQVQKQPQPKQMSALKLFMFGLSVGASLWTIAGNTKILIGICVVATVFGLFQWTNALSGITNWKASRNYISAIHATTYALIYCGYPEISQVDLSHLTMLSQTYYIFDSMTLWTS